MRYHYTNSIYTSYHYGEIYACGHPVYDTCTLYRIGNKGLAVIQQHRLGYTKNTFWGSVDARLVDPIYLNEKFESFFNKYAKEPDVLGLYPTVTVRQIMWALRMKPLPKQRWETTFDHKNI